MRILPALLLASCTSSPKPGTDTGASSDTGNTGDTGHTGDTSTSPGPRTISYTWSSFLDIPMVQDAWEKREEVGFNTVRSYTWPITFEAVDVDGPDLYPGIAATRDVYAPAHFSVDAKNLADLTIDTIGGVHSPAPNGQERGLLPYDLMGGLGTPPDGGTAHLVVSDHDLDRDRANELNIPEQFGYHGWEQEARIVVTMDLAAARKVLGIPADREADIADWWAENETAAEQAFRWWVFDEGGDTHVGGQGRKDVRFAFNCPLTIFWFDLGLTADGTTVTLTADMVWMAGNILWARWLSDVLDQPAVESNSYADIEIDATIGPTSADLAFDASVDYALYKNQGGRTWTLEASSADIPNYAANYLDESTYVSPGLPYAEAVYAGTETGYDYVPAAFVLSDGDTLTYDWSDVAAKGGVNVSLHGFEPPAADFPDQVTEEDTRLVFSGPMDMGAWSVDRYAAAWRAIATPAAPDGQLPWGEPYLTFEVSPDADHADLFEDAVQPDPVSDTDPYREVPAFPDVTFDDDTPALPSEGRTLRFDFYDFFRNTMNPDRWATYVDNDYVRVGSLEYPVVFFTTAYWSGLDPDDFEPHTLTTSGLRLRIEGHEIPEITIDNMGGLTSPAPEGQEAGFLPYNLLGGLESGTVGGTARFEGHMAYGTEDREALYRMQQFWGFYGWENFVDARITLDRAAARKVLGISDADFSYFDAWWAGHETAVEQAWKLWLYDEFVRTAPMPWFNYPLQSWTNDLTLVSSDTDGVVLAWTNLNEALDVVIGRWLGETIMPAYEVSYDDMYLDLTIGPTSSEVRVDTSLDFSGLVGDDLATEAVEPWTWRARTGDNPYLANEYRYFASPAWPYYSLDAVYTDVPCAWDLAEGEQVNFHFGDADLTLATASPSSEDLPDNVIADPSRFYSITGPVDLEAWSQAVDPAAWAATGGLVPEGVPKLTWVGE